MSWKTVSFSAAVLFFAWVTVGVVVSLITIGPVEETCTTFGGMSPRTECDTQVSWLAVILAAVFLGCALLGLLASILALRGSIHHDDNGNGRVRP